MIPVLPFEYTQPTIENTLCFVINLDRDKHKWDSTRRVVDTLGFPVERFPAVLGTKVDKHNHPMITTYGRYFLEPATIGIFLSHRSAWETVVSRGLTHALIVEDDLFLDKPVQYIQHYLTEALHELSNGWDILYLGYAGLTGSPTEVGTLINTVLWYNPFMKKQEYKRVSKRLCTPAFPLALHAYMVSFKGCQKFLNDIREINTHVDLKLAQLFSGGGYKVYAVEERMIQQSSLHTTGATSSGDEGVVFEKLVESLSSNDKLPYEQDIKTSFRLSAGSFLGWKFASLLTATIAVFSVLAGIVTVDVNYALVGCFFLLLNAVDYINGFGWSRTGIILANTAVCLVCGYLGRLIVKRVVKRRVG